MDEGGSSPEACLICGGPHGSTACPEVDGTPDPGVLAELRLLDEQVEDLLVRREALVARAVAPPPPPPDPGTRLEALPPPPSALPPPPGPQPWPSAPGMGTPAGGPQLSSILLGTGTALIIVAALVFAAVSWDRLSALGQGLLLVGLVASAATGSWFAARHRLQGTAEALGVLAVALAPLVAQALRVTLDLGGGERSWSAWIEWSWWPISLAAIGGGALAFGRAAGVRSTGHLGAVVVQVAAGLWLALAPISAEVGAVALGVLALASAEVARRLGSAAATLRTWKAGAALWAGVALLIATGAAFGRDLDGGGRALAALVLVAVAAALGAIDLRWRPVGWRGGADAAQVGAAAAVLAAIARLVVGVVSDGWVAPSVGAAAVGLVVVALAIDRARLAPTRAVAGAAIVGTSAPLVTGIGLVTEAAAEVADGAWTGPASASVPIGGGGPVAWGLAAIAVLVAWATAERRAVGRRTEPFVIGAAAIVVALVVPPLAGWPVAVVLAIALLVVALVAHVAVVVRPAPVEVVVLALVATAGLAGAWSAVTPAATLVALLVATGLAGRTVQVGMARQEGDLGLAAGVVGAAAGFGALLVALVLAEVDPGPTALVVSLVAAATVAVVARWAPEAAERPPAAGALASGAVVVVAAAVHVVTLLALADADDPGARALLTAAMVVGAVATAVAGARRAAVGRSWVEYAAASAAEAVAVIWYRLAEADIAVVEAYTTPLAAVAALGALSATVGPRGDGGTRPSWLVEGPAVALLLVPTALVALGDPGMTRQLLALVGGAVVLVAGVTWRRRALVDVAVAVLAVVGGQALAPYAAEVPRWLSIGLVGALLVGVGATFEQRRRDVSEARRRYRSLA
ncbi:MAG: hypothetical protein KDA97_12185 [Acidimicrobiales bacterium]|nr:hypothetical protein [Acidimicrobiales bacterium]